MIIQILKKYSFSSAFLVSAVFFSPMNTFSHESKLPETVGISDFQNISHGHLALKVKMIPSSSLSDSLESIRTYTNFNFTNEKKTPEVGKIAYIYSEFTENQIPVSASYKLKILHTEKKITVLKTELTCDDGKLIWGHQFYDAGPYKIEISAKKKGQPDILYTTLNTSVEGIAPPALSMIKSLILLLLITAAGIFSGSILKVFIRR
ncbi:MAG: hypothetical protein OEZ34_01950 [Spirochaetia bacterium]|nr:hypothetical protein [Spirochaetia bacterium]